MYQKGITFVIPAYNTEHTISRTLESILRQTDQHYEVIIVNDGSSDHTEDICKKYAEEYPDKICYIYQENRGLGGARNHGMRLAGREYVAFLAPQNALQNRAAVRKLPCIHVSEQFFSM